MKLSSPSEQVDPALVLGALPPPLPEIVTARQLLAAAHTPPPQIIDGVLHQGCKLLLSGTSKSNKSWSLLDLAISVASGQPWWGRNCIKAPVVYINFELHRWAITHRLNALTAARPECGGLDDSLALWNLRGRNADLTLLRPMLEEGLEKHRFGLIILDPAYKLLGDRDENSNGDIAGLMNEVEALAQKTGAAVALAHHFAKGDSTAKASIDRMSGAGTWARDPDSLVVLTPHEEDDCFTVNMTVRNLPRVDDFVVRWDYPLMRAASDLNPDALRRPQAKNKVCSDREFVEQFVGDKPVARRDIVASATEKGISPRTADRYLQRLSQAGLISCGSGLYWRSTR